MIRRAWLSIVALVLLSGCSIGPRTVTEQGEQAADLWRIFMTVAIVIAAFVYVLVVVAVIRFRRRGHDDRAAPGQRQYFVSLEVVYTVVPLVIVGVLFGLSLRAEQKVTSVTERPDLEVEVIGFQWQWQFHYEGTDVRITGVPGEIPVLVLPTERRIVIGLESRDVVHAFWVPEFNEKRDVVPGRRNEIEVRLTEVGEWDGKCSEFCGLDHWKMTFRVRALPPEDFDAWLSAQEAS